MSRSGRTGAERTACRRQSEAEDEPHLQEQQLGRLEARSSKACASVQVKRRAIEGVRCVILRARTVCARARERARTLAETRRAKARARARSARRRLCAHGRDEVPVRASALPCLDALVESIVEHDGRVLCTPLRKDDENDGWHVLQCHHDVVRAAARRPANLDHEVAALVLEEALWLECARPHRAVVLAHHAQAEGALRLSRRPVKHHFRALSEGSRKGERRVGLRVGEAKGATVAQHVSREDVDELRSVKRRRRGLACDAQLVQAGKALRFERDCDGIEVVEQKRARPARV
eukprot:4660759-Pleurochrysis_carterae.AAC.2